MALKAGNTSSETVKVVIRCRPMSEKEMSQGHECVVEINLKANDIFVSKPGVDEAPKQFTFDACFDWKVRQVDIYE